MNMILIGKNNSNHLVMKVPKTLSTDANNEAWNGVQLAATCGAWQGKWINVHLLTEEIISFYKELEAMYSSLSGEAELQSIEGWVELKMKCSSLGVINCSGHLRDDAGFGNLLKFEIDQSYIKEAVAIAEQYIK